MFALILKASLNLTNFLALELRVGHLLLYIIVVMLALIATASINRIIFLGLELRWRWPSSRCPFCISRLDALSDFSLMILLSLVAVTSLCKNFKVIVIVFHD